MEILKFIENLSAQFDEPNTNLTPNTKFRELEELSSLVKLSIIAMVDEEYSVNINGDDIRNSTTINDLFEIVKSKM